MHSVATRTHTESTSRVLTGWLCFDWYRSTPYSRLRTQEDAVWCAQLKLILFTLSEANQQSCRIAELSTTALGVRPLPVPAQEGEGGGAKPHSHCKKWPSFQKVHGIGAWIHSLLRENYHVGNQMPGNAGDRPKLIVHKNDWTPIPLPTMLVSFLPEKIFEWRSLVP